MNEISTKELFSSWAKKSFKNVYYFVGEEKTLKESAIKKLKEIINPSDFNFSKHSLPEADVSSVISEANTTSVFSDLRIVILDGLEKLKVSEVPEIIKYVKDPSPDTCLILISDKKKPATPDLIAKNLNRGAFVSFEKFNAYEAESFLRSQIEKTGAAISPEAIEIIIELAGLDMATLENEAAKLIAYHHGKTTPINEKDALQSIGFSQDQNPFELAKAIQVKNKDTSIKIIEDLLQQGMEPLRIIYTISTLLQKLLKVKILSNSGMPSDSMHYAAGISKGQYYYLDIAVRNFSKNALVKNIERCLEAEALFKSSRNKNPVITLKQIVYGIMRSK
jgi:DNA polymerase III subunit delta